MTEPPLPPSEERTIVQEGAAVPPPGRRVVVDEAPPRRDPWGWLLAALFAALAIVFLVLWLLQRDNADTKPAPNLVGLRAEEAQRDALQSGFRLEVVSRISDDPPGTVIAQGPEAGAELEQGAQMIAVVSSGRRQVRVPELVGLKRSAAERLVEPLGLELRVRVVPSPKGAGVVIEQDPAADTEVARGSTVTINVARGPSLVSVPSVQGLSVDEATAALVDAGLTPETIEVASSEPEGTVVAQDPPPGEKAKAGAKIRLNVSSGPAATQPTTVTSVSTKTVTRTVTTTETVVP